MIEKNYGKREEDSTPGSDPYASFKAGVRSSFISVNTELENHVPNC